MKHTFRQIGMIIIECVLYLGLAFMVYGVVGGLMVRLGLVSVDVFIEGPDYTDPYEFLYTYIPLAIASLLPIIGVHRFIFKRPYQFSGFSHHKLLPEFTRGITWAGGLLISGYLTLLAIGRLEIVKIEFISTLLLGYGLLFLIQSSFEEFVMRSFLLPTISHRSNIYWGLATSSILFAGMHIDNDHVSFIPILNLVLAGLLLGLLFIVTGRIWAAIGLHFGWNYVQGSILGFEVSGLEVYSLIDSEVSGATWLTGGSFGFEGSLLCSALLGGSCYVLVRRYRHILIVPFYQVNQELKIA